MLTLALAVAVGLVATASAWGSDPFPVEETFRGPAFGSQWRHGGSAELTAANEAEGWLRLTPAEGDKFGYAYDNEAFPSTAGALVEFEYADWGGSGADGLTFFLFNGATSEAEFHAGQPGGALGYASCDSTTNGLTNAYVGVGFDEYGNFTNLGSICGLDGTEFLANHVSVRGSAAESYKLLAIAQTTESLRAERSQARRVTIAITPAGRLSVYIRYPDGTYQKVTEGFQLPAAPETLKFGYVASTGALTDDHEIRNAQVIKPTQLTPSVTQTAGGSKRGEPLTWTAVVHNEGPNPTQREQVRANTGAQSLSNVSWTCEAAGGAACVTASGTGLPSLEAGAMPQGSSLTYKLTGTPTPSSDYAQVTIESEPRGDAGELDPEEERASAKTDLTPLFEQDPSFTLAGNGEASATPVGALGGDVSYSYAWQRCEADGTSCADIAGAEATSYHTTNADMGHTIRFTQTATNNAGSTTIDSAIYAPLPTAEITSAPARYLASREAVLSFVSSTKEATFECSLDGATWSQCASSISYADLAEGEHTFSVRAVYGGLSDPHPPSVRWTVQATPPPAPEIVSAPLPAPVSTLIPAVSTPEGTQSSTGTILECSLDGGPYVACTSGTSPKGLSKGWHTLTVRHVTTIGTVSSVTTHRWHVAGKHQKRRHADKHRHKAVSRRRVAKHGHEVDRRRHAARQKVTRRRHAGKHRHHAARHRHANQHKSQRKARRPASKPQPKAKTHRAVAKAKKSPPAATHPHRHQPSPPAGRPTPTRKAPAPHAVPPPQGRTHRPTAKHRSKVKAPPTWSKTPTPADKTSPTGRKPTPADKAPPTGKTPTPADKAPVPASEPKSKRSPPAHAHKPGTRRSLPAHTRKPETKPSSPATTQKPRTSSPANRHPSKVKAPSPAPSKRPKAKSPVRTPKSRAHAPAATRTSKRHGQRRTGTVGANLVIRPFRPRSSALVRRARRKIKRLATEIKHARRVVCVGYTDDLGARSANLALGLERARAVCAKLRALGVHAAFKAESRGEDRPCASNATARGRALNRRVELRITY